MRPKIIIAYDATPAAADGLDVGALLADLRGGDILVARVLPHSPSARRPSATRRRSFRATIQETRETAADSLDDRRVEVWPVFGPVGGRGLDDLAADRGAELIVFGSPHHGAVGRVLLGSAAAAVSAGRPAPSPSRRAASASAAARPAGRRRRVRRLGRVQGRGRRRARARARRGRQAER